MKTILFSTNFGESTTNALAWARLFAKQYAATLVLVYVQPIIASDTVLPVAGELGMGAGAMMDIDLEPVSQDQLNSLASEFEADGITCRTDLRSGGVREAILSAAAEHHADLIITGRSRIGNFFERMVGSEATGVAQKAHCPVLIVPAVDADSAMQPAQLKTIVFTTPLEFDQQEGFSQTVDIAHNFGASLRVLRVKAENQPNINDDEPMIGQLQEAYGSDTLPVDTVDARTVSGGIETYLTNNEANLLVMTTRERDFLSGLLNPSLTGRMVTLTHLPVLVFHAEAAS